MTLNNPTVGEADPTNGKPLPSDADVAHALGKLQHHAATPSSDGELSIQLQKLTAKYDVNDRDFVAMLQLISTHSAQLVREAEDAAVLNIMDIWAVSDSDEVFCGLVAKDYPRAYAKLKEQEDKG